MKTYKYNVDKLVYFESIHSINDAIARGKQIKNWKREWKNELVNKENPEWKDLGDSIGVTDEGIAGRARNDAPGQARNDAWNIPETYPPNCRKKQLKTYLCGSF